MTETWTDGVLRERWDDDARLYTAWDEAGVQIEQRTYTDEESTSADVKDNLSLMSANKDSIVSKMQTAQTNNATYLAIASPTSAQNTAQVKALTRQVNALIKLAINDLGNTTGT